MTIPPKPSSLKLPLKFSTTTNSPKGAPAKGQGTALAKKQGEFDPSPERASDLPCIRYKLPEYLSALQAFTPIRASIERAPPFLNAGALSGLAKRNRLQINVYDCVTMTIPPKPSSLKLPLKFSNTINRPKGAPAKGQDTALAKKQGEFDPSPERASDLPCPRNKLPEYLSTLQAFAPIRASIERAPPFLNAGAFSGLARGIDFKLLSMNVLP